MDGRQAIKFIEQNLPCDIKGLSILRLDGKPIRKVVQDKCPAAAAKWPMGVKWFIIGAIFGFSTGVIVMVVLS